MKAGTAPPNGHFALGHILVANGEITPAQLEEALHRQAHSGKRLGEELVCAGHASKKQIDEGLQLQRKIIAYALALSTGLVPLAPTVAMANPTAAVAVSAVVIANVKLRAVHQETQLTITAADVVRGYVDVASGSRFAVQTNSRTGYSMQFSPVGSLFASVQVDGLNHPVRFGPEGGTVVQRRTVAPDQAHDLSFRFVLQSDAQPGTYRWPLQMSVRAL